jgi:hypothetical protein
MNKVGWIEFGIIILLLVSILGVYLGVIYPNMKAKDVKIATLSGDVSNLKTDLGVALDQQTNLAGQLKTATDNATYWQGQYASANLTIEDLKAKLGDDLCDPTYAQAKQWISENKNIINGGASLNLIKLIQAAREAGFKGYLVTIELSYPIPMNPAKHWAWVALGFFTPDNGWIYFSVNDQCPGLEFKAAINTDFFTANPALGYANSPGYNVLGYWYAWLSQITAS